MLIPRWSTRFKRDVRLKEKRGKNLDKLKAAILLLAEEKALPPATTIILSKGTGRAIATSTLSRIGC